MTVKGRHLTGFLGNGMGRRKMRRFATVAFTAAAVVGATLVPVTSAVAAAPAAAPANGVVTSVDALFAAAPPAATDPAPSADGASAASDESAVPSTEPAPDADASTSSDPSAGSTPSSDPSVAASSDPAAAAAPSETAAAAKAKATVKVAPKLTAIAVGWPAATPEVDKSYMVPVQVTPKLKVGVRIQRQIAGPGTQPWKDLFAGSGTTNANGVGSLMLNIPDAQPANYRVVSAGVGSPAKRITATAFGNALYNVPLQKPGQPGQLIKAQELTAQNAGPGFPLTYPQSPLAVLNSRLTILPSTIMNNAGNPDCSILPYGVNGNPPRSACTIGNQIDTGLQPAKQFRFLYTDTRMVPNDCPPVPGARYGDCNVSAKPGTEAASALAFVPANVQPGAKVVAWAHPTLGQANGCSVTRGTGTNTLNVTRSLDFPVPAGSTVLTIAGGTGGLSTGWVVTGTGIAPGSAIASIEGATITLSKATTGQVDGPITIATTAAGGVDTNLTDMEGFLDQMLAKGYIVVLPDYLGIAVNGPTSTQKTYMVGQQEARDLYYAVKALQTPAKPALGWSGIPKPGVHFVAMGHSQGGTAAMWAGVEKKTLDRETGLRLIGVTAVAPAGDLNAITAWQWDSAEAWYLAPGLWQTYGGYLPELAKQNMLLSDTGRQIQPTLQNLCVNQIAPVLQDRPYLIAPNVGRNIDKYLRWGFVFFGQTPIIEQGHVNSFPKDLPLNLIAAQGDSTVLAQQLAALQQGFCKAGAKVTAYWTPVISGMLPGLAGNFGAGGMIGQSATHTTVLGWPFGNNGTAFGETKNGMLAAGSAMSFADERFAKQPLITDCGDTLQKTTQNTIYGLWTPNPGTPASVESWYSNSCVPLLMCGGEGLTPQSWLGSKALAPPVVGGDGGPNPAPAGATVEIIGDLSKYEVSDIEGTGCVNSWGSDTDYKLTSSATPENPACTKYGLFPWNYYMYYTIDKAKGWWGNYPYNNTFAYADGDSETRSEQSQAWMIRSKATKR